MGETLQNADGLLKDTYSKSNDGFKKALPHKCKICGKHIRHSGGSMCSKCSHGATG